MRILVNVLPVYRGGGLQNALNLWRAIGKYGEEDEWLLVCRKGMGYGDETTAPWQSIEEWDSMSLPARLWWDNVKLPRIADRWSADVIFTPMGTGPLRPRKPSVLGWHDSTVVYPESEFWGRLTPSVRLVKRLRHRIAGIAARGADRVCVQTQLVADLLAKRWNIPQDRFVIVPNGPSDFLSAESVANDRPIGTPWRVLCIGEPKPTKNLEIIPEVASVLAGQGHGDGEFVLTFSLDSEPYLEPFRAAVAKWGEAVPLKRAGQVLHRELGDLYRDADIVFLPSLLESFSATYVEAMYFGVPLVTSDRAFARDICGDAAEYVNPLDPRDCARGLLAVLKDSRRRSELREAGFRRVRTFPDWAERFRRYRGACYAVAGRPLPDLATSP